MKFLSKVTKLFVLCFSLLLTGQAYAGYMTLQDQIWGIDPDGDGDTSNAVMLLNMDYDSFTYVSFSDATHFTDYGFLYSTDDSALKGMYAKATLTGEASGSNASFDAGSTMNWYDASDNLIMTLTLIYGDSTNVALDPVGGTISGSLRFQFEITYVAEDYFYIWDGVDWIDLADLIGEDSPYYMEAGSQIQRATNNLLTVEQNSSDLAGTGLNILDELDSITGLPAGSAQSAINTPSFAGFVTFNDGNVFVGVVPEPGMLSLMGLAFLGFAGFQSRRKSQQNS
ncbi:PEP-CTERM sorting domain-containing protein [Vibrio ziniensis]|uniref:PEP-CTERM sorting domain-containing protein n=1 Tax=Vibrio ziniensis TaxID=2711221 RepID=A0A6G7CMF2_9VIBR|nr:PEP-CTERM sorting domain-containing protein [Vibrio ziniensis]QIH43311.1 PEP-CTERM sorting domain-containing protein [Vibrio ziniensis]